MANLISKVKESFANGELSLINAWALKYQKCPELMSIDVVIVDEHENSLALSNLMLNDLPRALSVLRPEVVQRCIIYMNVPNTVITEECSETHYELFANVDEYGKLRLETMSFTPDESFEFRDGEYKFITDREELQIIHSLYGYIRSLNGMSKYLH